MVAVEQAKNADGIAGVLETFELIGDSGRSVGCRGQVMGGLMGGFGRSYGQKKPPARRQRVEVLTDLGIRRERCC